MKTPFLQPSQTFSDFDPPFLTISGVCHIPSEPQPVTLNQTKTTHHILPSMKDTVSNTTQPLHRTATDYFGSIVGRHERLDPEAEAGLLAQIAAREPGWEAAADKVLLGNLRLVIAIAKTFACSQVEVSDLYSEGVLGLRAAIERFKPDFGSPIGYYAGWWIRRYIMRYLREFSHPIRLTHTTQLRSAAFERVRSLIAADLGRNPTPEEICEETGMDLERVEHLCFSGIVFMSLDDTLGEGGSPVHEMIADENASGASDMFDSDFMARALAKVSAKHQDMFFSRFGLNGREAMSFAEIAAKFKVSRQGADQAVNRVLDVLRAAIKEDETFATARLPQKASA